MNNSKKWYQSVTVIASVTVFATVISSIFEVKIENQEVISIIEQSDHIYSQTVTLIASILAIYGRFTATKQIK